MPLGKGIFRRRRFDFLSLLGMCSVWEVAQFKLMLSMKPTALSFKIVMLREMSLLLKDLRFPLLQKKILSTTRKHPVATEIWLMWNVLRARTHNKFG